MDTSEQLDAGEMLMHSDHVKHLIGVCQSIAFRGEDKRPSTQLTILAESILEQLASPDFSPFASVAPEATGKDSNHTRDDRYFTETEVRFDPLTLAMMQERAEIYAGAILEIIHGCRVIYNHSDYDGKRPVVAISMVANEVLQKITHPDFRPFAQVKPKPAST